MNSVNSVFISVKSFFVSSQPTHHFAEGQIPVYGDSAISKFAQNLFENIASGVTSALSLVGRTITNNSSCARSLIENISWAASPSVTLLGKSITEISEQIEKGKTIEKNLQAWVRTGGEEWNHQNREKAAKRILQAYKYKTEALDLSYCRLTTLPAEIWSLTSLQELQLDGNRPTILPAQIGSLTSLQVLKLGNNQLTTLPAEIWSLTRLESLYLSNNQLTTLPAEIGSLTRLKLLSLVRNQLTTLPAEIGSLTSLQNLYLDENQLTTLPVEIGSLTSLQNLYLNGNRLTTLPVEIGSLTSLERLSLYNNPSLRSLPMGLGNCRLLTYIDLDGTCVSNSQQASILTRARAARDAEGLLKLPDRLATWKAYAESQVTFEFLEDSSNFSDAEKIKIGEWLIRLERCQDFSYKRKELAGLVCNMLATLATSPQFKDVFFGLLEYNLTACDDRASMLLNLIYTDWRLCTMDDQATDKEKIELLVSLAKTLTLRSTLESMIKEHEKKTKTILGESVEIFLYHEIKQKKNLNLLTAIDNMHYGEIGKAANVVNETALVQAVNDHYQNTLADQEVLHKILLKYPEYVKRMEAISNDTDNKFGKIEDKTWDREEDYKTALEDVTLDREMAIRSLRIEFANSILAGVQHPMVEKSAQG